MLQYRQMIHSSQFNEWKTFTVCFNSEVRIILAETSREI